jgi:hypothetical protein
MINLGGGNNPYPYRPGQTIPTGGGGALGGGLAGLFSDPEKKAKLIQAAPIILAMLAGGKNRGIAAASAAQGVGQAAQAAEEQRRYDEQQAQLEKQRAEEQRRYENELKRQAWLDTIAREQAAREKAEYDRQQKEREQLAQYGVQVGGELSTMGAGTPEVPGTAGTPAVEYAWNQPGYGAHVTPEDREAYEASKTAGTMPADQPAVAGTPGTPAVPGDQVAQYWANALNAMPGNSTVIANASAYLLATKQGGGVSRDVSLALQTLSPDNPYIPALLQPGLTPEEFDKAAKDCYDFEAKKKNPDELATIRARLELVKAQTAAANRSNRPKTEPEQKKTYTDTELTGIISQSKNPTTNKTGSFEGAMYAAITSGNVDLAAALMDRWNKLHPKDQRNAAYWRDWYNGIA